MTTITIPEKECEKIARHYGIADVYLFGSQATGFARSPYFFFMNGSIPIEKEKVADRNRLVHLYWEVAPEELVHTLQEDMEDFEEFIEYVEQFLQKQGRK